MEERSVTSSVVSSPVSSEGSVKSRPKRGSYRRDSLLGRLSSGARRNSLSTLKMRDIVLLDKFEEVKEAAIAEHATERSWHKPAEKVEQEPTKPKPKPKPTKAAIADECWRRGSMTKPKDLEEEESVLRERAPLTPPTHSVGLNDPPSERGDWAHAAAILAASLRAVGCRSFSPQAAPTEVQTLITTCEPAVFTAYPAAPRSSYETSDNLAKRQKAQKDPRAAPIVPRAECESECVFTRRLNAARSLVDLRSGPQRVLVLPQQNIESAAIAIERLEAQGTCPATVMPIGPAESHEAFTSRLEALRATPRPAAGAPRCAPVLARGKHESDASFALRLDVAVYCSAVVLPQAAAESDADAALRLEAQREAPHTFIDTFRPQNEDHDAFAARCAATDPAKRAAVLGKRPSSERLPLSPRRMRRASTAAPRVISMDGTSAAGRLGSGCSSGRSSNQSGRSKSRPKSRAKSRPRTAEKQKMAGHGAWSLVRILSSKKAMTANKLGLSI